MPRAEFLAKIICWHTGQPAAASTRYSDKKEHAWFSWECSISPLPLAVFHVCYPSPFPGEEGLTWLPVLCITLAPGQACVFLLLNTLEASNAVISQVEIDVILFNNQHWGAVVLQTNVSDTSLTCQNPWPPLSSLPVPVLNQLLPNSS